MLALLTKIEGFLVRMAMYLATTAVALLLAVQSGDIVGRYLLRRPIPGAIEICENLLVAIVFLALAYADSQGHHIRIMLLTDRLPKKAQRVLNVLSLTIGLAISALIAWQTLRYGYNSFLIRETTMGSTLKLPIYPFKLMVGAGTSLLALQFVVNLAREIAGKRQQHGTAS